MRHVRRAAVRRAVFAGLLAALAASTAFALALANAAQADVFEPISLASTRLVTLNSGEGLEQSAEQATIAEHPAISGNGRYVAFDGSFAGVSGVWRRDLVTGAVQQVAGGRAQLPSISDDGRFISFTTGEGAHLAEITDGQPVQATHEPPNVYVRDMERNPTEAGAFSVVSAPSGSEAPLSYETSGSEAESIGSFASGRSAMSADGRYVAFVVAAGSNLAGPKTPPLQVAVRDRQTKETKLASVEYEAASGATTGRPVPAVVEAGNIYGAVRQNGALKFPTSGTGAESQGASISADGTTVAWLGQEIERQAVTFPKEDGLAITPQYAEPLWRRLGSSEPARRITGGGDPANQACVASGETEAQAPLTLSDPCQGPFEPRIPGGERGVYPATTNVSESLPRLSANGVTVAFLASQPTVAQGEEFRGAENSTDLYAVDMASGLSRVAALRRLTEIGGASSKFGQANTAPIEDLGVSPDGTEVAFSSERVGFPLGSPAYVSVPAATKGISELYDVDLADDTLTRVTHGYQGEAQQSEAPGGNEGSLADKTGAPSFSDDGNTLAFASAADNLVFGEGNKASSVFVVTRRRFEAEGGQQYVSPPPEAPNTEPSWLLGVTVHSSRDGTVLLEVLAPGAGRLSASAAAAVRVGASRSKAARRRRRARSTSRRRTSTVASRRVASAATSAPREGLVTLKLALTPHYRALASQRGGLSASVTLAFAATGHAVLRQTVSVTFVRAARSAKRAKRAARSAKRAKPHATGAHRRR